MSIRRNAKRTLTTLGASVAAVLLSFAITAPAHASQDVGWLYAPDGGSRGYFDADVAGWTGAEEIIACDIKTDGKASITFLYDTSYNRLARVRDTYNDGGCTSTAGNFVTDERAVIVVVCTDDGGDILFECAEKRGVS
jgi:hypothetical protein